MSDEKLMIFGKIGIWKMVPSAWDIFMNFPGSSHHLIPFKDDRLVHWTSLLHMPFARCLYNFINTTYAFTSNYSVLTHPLMTQSIDCR